MRAGAFPFRTEGPCAFYRSRQPALGRRLRGPAAYAAGRCRGLSRDRRSRTRSKAAHSGLRRHKVAQSGTRRLMVARLGGGRSPSDERPAIRRLPGAAPARQSRRGGGLRAASAEPAPARQPRAPHHGAGPGPSRPKGRERDRRITCARPRSLSRFVMPALVAGIHLSQPRPTERMRTSRSWH